MSYGRMSLDYQVSDLYKLPGTRAQLHRRPLGRRPVGRRQVRQGAEGRDRQRAERAELVEHRRRDGADGRDEHVAVPPRPGHEVHAAAGAGRREQARRLRDLQREPEPVVDCRVGTLGARDRPRLPGGRAGTPEQLQQQLRADGRAPARTDGRLREARPPSRAGCRKTTTRTSSRTWAARRRAGRPRARPCGGALVNVRAEERDPLAVPNMQAARAYISGSLYFLISVRERVSGDELDGRVHAERHPRPGRADRTRAGGRQPERRRPGGGGDGPAG